MEVYEDDKKRKEWKISVVETEATETDGIVRGALVRVITNLLISLQSEDCSSYFGFLGKSSFLDACLLLFEDWLVAGCLL